jgi:hypothetical protein
MLLLLLIFSQSYSFKFLENKATNFIKNKINFSSILPSNLSQALSIFAAGAGISLMTDRPYKTIFFLTTLYFLHLKRNKELKTELEKNFLEKEKVLSEEKSNSNIKMGQLEERNQAILKELQLKYERDIASQKEIDESRQHDDVIIQKLRRQNIVLAKELHQAYEKYAPKMDLTTSNFFKKRLVNILLSPLLFHKQKNKKIN